MTLEGLLAAGVFVAVPIAGWLATGRRPLVEDRIGRVPIVVAAGIATWSVPILGLLILRIYSPHLIGALGWLLAAGWFAWEGRRLRPRVPRLHPSVVALLVGLALAAWLYAAFPADPSIAGRDMQVYSLHGVYMSHHGRLDVPYPADLADATGVPPGWVGFTGLHSTRPTMSVQFGHLYPAWLAQANAVLGFDGLLRLNVAFALLAALAVFAVARTMVPSHVAALAALVLALNPAQLWTTRNTLTEVMTQLFIWCGFLLMLAAIRRRERMALAWTGAFLGVAAIVRIDALVLLPLLLAGHAVARTLSPSGKEAWRTGRDLYVVAIPLFGLAVAYYAAFTNPYFRDLGAQLRSVGLAALAAGGFYAATWVPAVRRMAGRALTAPPVTWGAATLIVFAVAFAYFVRPTLEPLALIDVPNHRLDGTRSYIEDALPNLGRYLGPPVVWLAIAGWLGAGIAGLRGNHRLVPLAVAVGGYGALYLWNQSIFPDHFWAIRRFVPVIMPAAVVFAGVAGWFVLRRLPRGWRPYAFALAAIGLAVYSWRVGTPYAFVAERAGTFAALERFAGALPADTEYLGIFTGGGVRSVATPLYLAFETQVVPISVTNTGGREEVLRRIAGASPDRPVSVITDLPADAAVLRGRTVASLDHRYQLMRPTNVPVPSVVAEASIAMRALEVTGLDTVGIAFGGRSTWIAAEDGFWGPEVRAGQPVRWTTGQATLTIPIYGGEIVRAVRIELLRGAPGGSTVDVFIDGRLAAAEEVGADGLSATYELAAPRATGEAEIRLVSDSWVLAELDPDSADQRELGVLVGRIELVPDEG
jgi:hypothetical protein